MSVHDRLDMAQWIAEFPLSRLRSEARDFVLNRQQKLPSEYPDQRAVERHIQLMRPEWRIVVGPRDVAINEQLRVERLAEREYTGRRYPTDVAVWAKGEPSNRAITKVGGLPYRPVGVPWPEDDAGTRLRFVAQICFVDSRDILATYASRTPGPKTI